MNLYKQIKMEYYNEGCAITDTKCIVEKTSVQRNDMHYHVLAYTAMYYR
jgi:hypothetical protein